MLTQPILAIVGARKASSSGLLLAQHFSSALGLAGYHIISSMAYGIDSATHGLLLSEYPPGTDPKGFHFPRRNRIVAALSLGVVVIEDAQKSGSLITAHLASSLGREVFVLPKPITSPPFWGSHQLIQEGAKLVKGPQDVLEELPNLRLH